MRLAWLAACALLVTGASAAENLRATLYFLYPNNLTLYGQAKDAANPGNNTFQVKVCWDDPTFTNNCDTPLTANTSGSPSATCSATCFGFGYTVPAGTVGGVAPRDGNTHLMYLKQISQANPGTGDRVVDGSPWPFTYRNGTVAQMWPANLEAQPARLGASQLAILANSQDPYSVGSTGNVVCTSGGTAIKDDGVVGYYVARHAVPCGNVYVVSVAVKPTIAQNVFTSAIAPALQALPASIQAITLGWVQPSVVVPTSGGYYEQAISAVVANGGMVNGSVCFDGPTGLGYGPINPYFNSTSKAPFTDYNLRPTMMLAGESCATCTATNNYSHPWAADFSVAKSMIDAAVAAANTDPTGGNVYWAWTGDPVRTITALVASPLTFGAALSPKVNAQVLGGPSSPAGSTISQKNILLFDQGSATWNYANPTFTYGAGIGFGVTSTSGYLPYDGNQTNAASWIAQGAVGAFGDGVEPCGLFIYKSPDPAIIVPNYTQGQTLIESLWKSVRLPWQGNFVGDPLAAPFSLPAASGGPPPPPPPAPAIASLTPNAAAAGSLVNVTITGTNFSAPATVTVAGGAIAVSNVVVVNPTTITAVFQLGPSLPRSAAKAYAVTVTTSDGTSNGQIFSFAASLHGPSVRGSGSQFRRFQLP